MIEKFVFKVSIYVTAMVGIWDTSCDIKLDNLLDNLKGLMTPSYSICPVKYIVYLLATISLKVYATSLDAQRICSDFYLYLSLWDRP